MAQTEVYRNQNFPATARIDKQKVTLFPYPLYTLDRQRRTRQKRDNSIDSCQLTRWNVRRSRFGVEGDAFQIGREAKGEERRGGVHFIGVPV